MGFAAACAARDWWRSTWPTSADRPPTTTRGQGH
jgi:hypothetical protein